MGRIARSFELTRQSYRVLMHDKELLLLPLLSGLAILALCATFLAGMLATGAARFSQDDPLTIAAGLVFYIVTYTIGFFFQAALIAGACERMAGGDPTLSSALGAASKRLGAIVLWGVIAGTVGMILKAIQERSQLVGRIVVGLIGFAWSLATYFMVPVLVMEEEPISTSFKRSAALFKKTWGESVVGNFGIGLASFIVLLPIVLVCMGVAAVLGPLPAIVVGLPLVALTGVFFSALQGVFVASLYRYATVGEVSDGFDRELLSEAFRPKG